MRYFTDDDIVQIGSPQGQSLIGAIRLSGPNAFRIVAAVATGLERELASAPARMTRPCAIRLELSRWRGGGPDAATLPCPARVFFMPAPASYTREHVVEIHLPGSPAILRAALGMFVRAGARLAGPGEFTFRAFRNGRITLGQAEAVEQVIRSDGEAERQAALARLGDTLPQTVHAWRDKAMDAAARLEAALDFSEEELDGDVAGEVADLVASLEAEGVAIGRARPAGGADAGLPRVALVGLANAGKSSLFNALLGTDDAIVSPLPSTTRDRLRRDVAWDGVGLTLSDNPGHAEESSEQSRQVVERAMAGLGAEDVACWVLDGSREPGERERAFAGRLERPVCIVLNKSDLPARCDAAAAAALASEAGIRVVAVLSASAARGDGVLALRTRLAALCRTVPGAERWNRREALELAAALAHCRAAGAELGGAARLELAAEELRAAIEAFSRAMGQGYAEEALERIFSTFCIGK